MTKVLKWVGILFGSLVVLGVIIFVVSIRPFLEEEKQLRSVLPVKASEFVNCLQKTQIDFCYSESLSSNFRREFTLNQIELFANKMRTKLGQRLSAELVDETFHFSAKSGTQGAKKYVQFAIAAIYENDLSVHEIYGYELDPESNDFKLLNFEIRSDRMLE